MLRVLREWVLARSAPASPLARACALHLLCRDAGSLKARLRRGDERLVLCQHQWRHVSTTSKYVLLDLDFDDAEAANQFVAAADAPYKCVFASAEASSYRVLMPVLLPGGTRWRFSRRKQSRGPCSGLLAAAVTMTNARASVSAVASMLLPPLPVRHLSLPGSVCARGWAN